jgi:hypothetical protein
MATRKMTFTLPDELADRFLKAVLFRNGRRTGAIFGDREAV